MKKLILLSIFCVCYSLLNAQYEDRYWIFGRPSSPANTANISFDFYPQFPSLYDVSNPSPAMANPPNSIAGSDGFESWAVVTNPGSGELVFYTDGNRVFDAQHNDITPSGALGAHSSSSQPVATCIEPICPFDKYYIFSNPMGIANVPTPLPGPVTYRIYDSTNKTFSPQQSLPGPHSNSIVGEGMIIIPSKNNPLEFWLITRLRDPVGTQPSTYVVYRVDENGVSFANETQFGPSILASPIMNMAYRDIASSNSEVLLGFSVSRLSGTSPNRVFTRRFDTATGAFIGSTNMIDEFPGGVLYDLEFSPAGGFLYYATYFNSLLYQAPIDPNTGERTGPPILVYDFGSSRAGGLKLGPDGYIYHSANAGNNNSTGTVRLGRIVQPDLLSTGNSNFAQLYERDIVVSPATFAYGFPEFVNIPDWSQLGYNPFNFAGLGEDQTLCDGEALVLSADIGTANYLWQDNSTNSTLTVTQAGTYWVEVEVNGCTQRDTIEIAYTSGPQFALGADTVLCPGETLTLNATTPNAAYLWQDNSTNATLEVNTPGIYWVAVSVNDCIRRDTIAVDFSSVATTNILGSDLSLCDGDVATLDATTPNATYLWQDNSTAATLAVNQAGTYWVEIQIGNCVQLDTVEVAYSPIPLVALGNDTLLCPEETLTLDATFSGATYLWQDNSMNAILAVNNAGIYWVETAIGNCTDRDTIVVEYSPLSVENILGEDQILCDGDSVMLDATVPGATYLWQDNSTDATLMVRQAGWYWVEIQLGDCIQSDSIRIDYRSLPMVDLGPDRLLCPEEVLTLDATETGATYLWQDSSTVATLEVSDSGSYWVELSFGSCAAADTVEVDYRSIAFGELGNDTTFCEGESWPLDVSTPDATYLWQDNSIDSSFIVTQGGTYWVDITVASCSFSDTIVLTEQAIPNFGLGADTLLCPNETLTLSASGDTYLWQDSSTAASFTATEGGLYWLELGINGCTSRDTILLSQSPLVITDLGPDTFVCSNEALLLSAVTPNATYLWSDNSTRPFLNVTEPGVYWVEATVVPCVFRDTVNVVQGFESCGCYIYLPNIFTPNFDGINDDFHPFVECPIVEYELHIFNRWGGKVFESFDQAIVWDGRTDGEECQNGAYTFVLKYRFEGQPELQIASGDVTLLR